MAIPPQPGAPPASQVPGATISISTKGAEPLRTVTLANEENLGSFGTRRSGSCCGRFHLVAVLVLSSSTTGPQVPGTYDGAMSKWALTPEREIFSSAFTEAPSRATGTGPARFVGSVSLRLIGCRHFVKPSSSADVGAWIAPRKLDKLLGRRQKDPRRLSAPTDSRLLRLDDKTAPARGERRDLDP